MRNRPRRSAPAAGKPGPAASPENTQAARRQDIEEGVSVGVKRSAATVGRATGRTGKPAAGCSGCVEAELEVAGGVGIEGGIGDAVVAKTLQQTLGDVLEAAEEGDGVCFLVALGKLLEETAFDEHLHHHVGNLQQRVEDIQTVRIEAVGVLHVQAAVLLVVEALPLRKSSKFRVQSSEFAIPNPEL